MNMKNKRPLILLFLACCLHQQSFGQTVFGVRDCGQWIARKDGAGARGIQQDRAWLAGYMTGLNVEYYFYRNNLDPLAKINSVSQIFLWMDNYCKKNPLSNLGAGGVELLDELKQKK
jgi:hypothetical protein